jgi:membrane protein YqaA with SNARE-associated domain
LKAETATPAGKPGLTGWKLTAVRVLALAGVISLSLLIFSLRGRAEEYAAYGYPGIFLLSLLSNATVILPAPGLAVTFAMGAVFHPVGVAMAAASGAALGELSGYVAGASGRGVLSQTATYRKIEGWTQRFGGWVILFLAFIPNPLFDVAGAAAGALRMSVPRFLLFAWVGKLLKMLLVAYAGASSMDWVVRLFGGM